MAELLAGPGVFALLAATAGTPGDPLGFILCRLAADEAEILSLGVTPDARRQGCAVALVEAAMRHAAVHGARRLYLEVAEDNAAARALYRSSGFEAVGRREAYYRRSEGALAAIVLARSLEPDMAAP